MRSRFLAEFIQNIAVSNDTLAYFNFIHEQFFIDHVSTIQENSTKFIPEVFGENHFRQQINITLGDLKENKSQMGNLLFKMVYMYAYTSFENYFKDFYSLVAFKFPEAAINRPEFVDYDTLVARLGQLGQNLDAQERESLDYLKYLRNHISHSDRVSAVRHEFKELIRRRGTILTRYWQSRLPFDAADELCFNLENVADFTYHRLILHIRLLRRLAHNIDKILLLGFNKDDLIRHALSRNLDKIKQVCKGSKPGPRKMNIIRQLVFFDYDIQPENQEIIDGLALLGYTIPVGDVA